MSDSMTATSEVPAVSTSDIEMAILAIEPEMDLDLVCAAIMKLDLIKERVRGWDKLLKEKLEAFITARGPFLFGVDKFCLTYPKETWCEDLPGAIDALLKAAETPNPETGELRFDLRKFVDVLSVNAIKPSVAKKDLTAEQFAKFFRTEIKTKLDRKKGQEPSVPEPPRLEVQRIDTRFVR